MKYEYYLNYIVYTYNVIPQKPGLDKYLKVHSGFSHT